MSAPHRRMCPERIGTPCETDDERDARMFGWPLPPNQDRWLCWTCSEPVADADIRALPGERR